ncbi:Glucose dehydrogenase (FAD,quinone) [Hypsibius exemplaris]|uniref:Glucose dehydrogenase (FAD,quinone) n=1 Tax=Hypsibius exemplaris TaxID=2072580 RepID=A0A1W0XF38_HYPEX|nr:Glucose dehydrogenase (FAD,quinone) [Hypsibius exemplaris]
MALDISFRAALTFVVLFASRTTHWMTELKTHDIPAREIFPGNDSTTKTYDFIIVGAGTAGCVVASRLAQNNPDWKILLLEAGSSEEFSHSFPFKHVAKIAKTPLDWNFTTLPLPYSGVKDHIEAGRVIGGSSSTNAMVYIRGNPEDFDGWARNGATGWSWADVLPYFIKSENNNNPELRKSKLHGTSGPMHTIDNPNGGIHLQDLLLAAAKEDGFYNADSNGESQLGWAPIQLNSFEGYRWSTANAYLRPSVRKNLPNLHVVSDAEVTRIVIDSATKTATGVEFAVQHEGLTGAPRKVVANARKEVVVSSGAINSPKLLLLSGIGPKAELDKHNITQLADLPVGLNLHDHYMLQMQFSTNDSRIGRHFPQPTEMSEVQEYATKGTGILAASPILVYGFFHLPNQAKLDGTPDTQPHVQASIANIAVAPGQSEFMLSPLLLRPRSTGRITLTDGISSSPPIIDHQILAENVDIEVYAEGWQFIVNYFVKSESFKQVNLQPIYPQPSNCSGLVNGSIEYYRCAVKQLTRSAWHPAGTCRMGNLTDERTVVDPTLRVKGIKGLRVADASVMPSPTSGNTHAPIVMVGEKAADMIIDSWKSNPSTSGSPTSRSTLCWASILHMTLLAIFTSS